MLWTSEAGKGSSKEVRPRSLPPSSGKIWRGFWLAGENHLLKILTLIKYKIVHSFTTFWYVLIVIFKLKLIRFLSIG